MNEHLYCVYCHTNKENGKRYFGITMQKVSQRWRHGLGYKKGPMHYAIKKYGWDGFEHEVLFSGLTEVEAKEKEKELIEKYQTMNRDYGYNITRGGDGTVGYKRSEAEKLAMSISRKGRHAGSKNPMYGKSGALAPHYGIPMSDKAKALAGDNIKKSWADGRHDSLKKAVIASKDGEEIRFSSISEASEKIGAAGTNISAACRGKIKTLYGYTWRYADRVAG